MKHNTEFFEMQSREINEDGPLVTLVLEAQDALHMVRDMTPDQRAKALPDIQEALAFLASAEKECQW